MNARYLASAFYFIYYASAGAMMPYINLYFKEVGMDTHQIGVLAALPMLAVLVASPLWGGIADALHLHKRLLPLVLTLSMLPAAVMMGAQTFLLLAVLVLVQAILTAPIIPLADNAALEMLGTESDTYGRLRIWGAVGYGLSAWGVGVVAEHTSILAVFVLHLVLTALTVLVASRLPAPPPVDQASFWAGLRALATNSRWLIFLFVIFMAGTCFSIFNNYLVIYLDDLGAGESLYGLSVAAAGVSELPVFWLSALLLQKLKPRGLLLMAFAMLVVRGMAYSLIRDPQWVVAAQLLHGPTFSALWMAGVMYARQIAPPGLGASAQAALGAVLFGLSKGAGALLGASLYDSAGPAATFRAAAGLALAGLIVFGSARLRRRRLA